MEENTKALEVNKEARAVKKQEDLDTKLKDFLAKQAEQKAAAEAPPKEAE